MLDKIESCVAEVIETRKMMRAYRARVKYWSDTKHREAVKRARRKRYRKTHTEVNKK